MPRKKFRISTDDYFRVLMTETLPYEVPLIFSNEGIYDFYKGFDNTQNIPNVIETVLGLNGRVASKIPFQYKISKDINSVRELSLVHPAVQFEFVEFYKNNDSLINYYCSKSEFSLRYPVKVASTVYEQRNNEAYNTLAEPINGLREERIELAGEDKRNEFSSNYFSYKKVNILYKFFESSEFIRLEKKFTRMTALDVSRCFDTIYTHSISWAVKNKAYIKKYLSVRNPQSFDDEFDCLIRKANDNETNGILIGPEFSRIFSEIIFQQIDQDIALSLLDKKLVHNRDYSIRRYIDDYYIFTKDPDIEDIVKEIITAHLWDYKFRINPSKTKYYIRPFTTERSRNIIDLRSRLESKLNSLIEKLENDEGNIYWVPKSLRHPLRASTSFIKDIKSCWHTNENLEAGFSNYVLSTLLTTYLNIIKFKKNSPEAINGNSMANFSIFVLDIAHYCFALKPKVSESYKFSQLIIIMTKFIQKNHPDYADKLSHKVHESLTTLLNNELSGKNVCGVEKFNVLLTLSSVDRRYLPKMEAIIELLFNDESTNYFNVIVALYLAKNDDVYSPIKSKALEVAESILANSSGINSCTETAHLFLDLMSCPYLNDTQKTTISKSQLLKLNNDQTFKNKIATRDLNQRSIEVRDFCKNKTWFVNWSDIDLLMKLQRKLLRESY